MPTILLASQCPSPPVYSGVHAVASAGPITSSDLTAGDTILTTPFNANATRSDLLGRYGGGGYAVAEGLDISAGSGLTLNIAAGHAIMDGIVEVPSGGTTATLTNNIARVWIWLSQAGAIVQVNNSLTPPAGAHVLLGSAVTSAGAITSVDQSGVLYRTPTGLKRTTADASTPTDTPSSKLQILHYGASGKIWLWTGSSYSQIASGGMTLCTLFQQTASVTVGNTAAETTLVGSGVGSVTLPANFFIVGRTLRVRAAGVISTAAGPGTLNIRIKFGATTIVTTGDVTPVASLSSRRWELQNLITCRTTGATGTVIASGDFGVMPTAQGSIARWEAMTGTSTVTIDTTATQACSVTADWSAAAAADTLTATVLVLESEC